MKPHKMKTTRPEFLAYLMSGGHVDQITSDDLSRQLADCSIRTYCAYTVLMDADIDLEDVEYITDDEESVAIRFRTKSLARQAHELCTQDTVRYGSDYYRIQPKLRDQYLILTVTIHEKTDSGEDGEL